MSDTKNVRISLGVLIAGVIAIALLVSHDVGFNAGREAGRNEALLSSATCPGGFFCTFPDGRFVCFDDLKAAAAISGAMSYRTEPEPKKDKELYRRTDILGTAANQHQANIEELYDRTEQLKAFIENLYQQKDFYLITPEVPEYHPQ